MSLKPKTKSNKKKQTRSLFFDTPADEELAQIITIRSPQEAAAAITVVSRMHENSSRDRQIHLERSFTLAANRAAAFLHNPELSPKEQREMKAVSRKYRTAVKKLRTQREEYDEFDERGP